MAYYFDHREEIDHQTAESEMLVKQLKRKAAPSLLQEKLRAMRSE